MKYHSNDFPSLVSYNRFVELMPQALMPLLFYLNTRRKYRVRVTRRNLVKLFICQPHFRPFLIRNINH